MRTNKNGVNKDQKDKVKKDGYNRGQHCVYCLTYNLELIYWTNNGGVKLPLEDWQYKVIAQVLGLSIQEDKNGNITFSHFPKDFVMKRVEKMGILIPVDGERKQK